MKTREEILMTIKDIMVEMFEMDEKSITLEARLYEDLDFDSIDAIDMIVRLKEITGKTIKPEDFKSARSIHDVVEAIYSIQ
ncbi:MAG: acyl carrier protein [Methylococcaceae bacterium]|nr:acyl carrier protein [Methylococcaceae bacterium]MDD1615275.1 acyl carrier protein [Methylococcaceae bacterium]OYV20766.1 MAG: acyl carrier protein [Methylococcaceae bacterium NSP1-2]